MSALRWSDVDLGDEPVVHVRGSLQRVNGRLSIVEPKTDESMRDAAIDTLGADALRKHRVRQSQERLRLGSAWDDNELVFTNYRGRFMAPDYFVRRHFQAVLLDAGLPRIRFHDLRHTFATLQLSNRQPVKIVSEMMGHTRTAITQDLYTHRLRPDAAAGGVSPRRAAGSRRSGGFGRRCWRRCWRQPRRRPRPKRR